MRAAVEELMEALGREGYVADRSIATSVHLACSLEKPLLVEGDAGVGKTEIAKGLSRVLGAELIRLQCYEGLDVHTSLYEWNYQKQLLRIRARENREAPEEELTSTIFDREYLLERPLLQALTRDERPVLLIDEIDRADEEFEAFLLEILSDFQVSIPELGTVEATHRPHVILTSNATRELSDALRRRCLYLWLDHPSREKELRILRVRMPELADRLGEEIVRAVHRLRDRSLYKTPGIAETLDWARAMQALEVERLDPETVRATLGCLLKDRHDLQRVREEGIGDVLEAAGRDGATGPGTGMGDDDRDR